MVSSPVENARHTLLSQLTDARAATDDLFRLVRPEAMYDRPIPERHRIVFYVGHLEAFDWNLFCGADNFAKASDPEKARLDRLFAFGIDPLGGDLPTDLPCDWPALQTVYAYQEQVRRELDRMLAAVSADDEDSAFAMKLNVAIEHRLMHAETLAYIFHQMPFERKIQGPVRNPLHSSPVTPRSARIPAGSAILGLPRDSAVFGWDNEFEQHIVPVPEFNIDVFKVTNGQFLNFIRAGGYQNRELWAGGGWEWRASKNITHPAFWVQRGDEWRYRSMFGEFSLPLDWPVYTSHAEATAYAKWSRKALPSEAQWHRAAGTTGFTRQRSIAGETFEPVAVNNAALPTSAFGVKGMLGNGWEWTSTRFAPFPGFQAFDCYSGYSAPFFDDRHYVLKGGSVRTAARMLRESFRNWFQPHYQYVYAGFRCVDPDPAKTGSL